jgi:hypothetical protein
LRAGARIEPMPDCALLFSEPDQQVHRLNITSAVVASRLQDGATRDELVAELSSRGIEAETGRNWVRELLNQLADLCLLEAQLPKERSPVAESRQLRLAGVPFLLRFGSNELLQLIGRDYAHLESDAGPPDHSYHLIEAGDFALLRKDDDVAHVVRRSMAAVRLKGAMLEDVLSSGGHLAALHAACLAKEAGALLLLGAPGTGKTIISLALFQHGFRYGSDDVTLLTRGGAVTGVSLPPAVKESAWALAESLGIRLSGIPVHSRPDGQRVRFYPLAGELLQPPTEVGAVVRLRRMAGTEAALESIPREEALCELLRESRSRDGRCSAVIMEVLAQLVRRADCFDLRYAEAADAASLLAGYDCG